LSLAAPLGVSFL